MFTVSALFVVTAVVELEDAGAAAKGVWGADVGNNGDEVRFSSPAGAGRDDSGLGVRNDVGGGDVGSDGAAAGADGGDGCSIVPGGGDEGPSSPAGGLRLFGREGIREKPTAPNTIIVTVIMPHILQEQS